MNRIKSVLVYTLFICMLSGCGPLHHGSDLEVPNEEDTTETFMEQDPQVKDVRDMVEAVDNRLDACMADEAFGDKSLEDRGKSVQKVLKELKAEGLIPRYRYSKEDHAFSVQYPDDTSVWLTLRDLGVSESGEIINGLQ